MDISQSEADALLALPKRFCKLDPVSFGMTDAFDVEHQLESEDKREMFLLDLERGDRRRIRLKFQTRARKIVVLARLDINGRAHRNPPGSPYRPDERFDETHLHIFDALYGDRIAYLPADVDGFNVPSASNDIDWLLAFLEFCNVKPLPRIQVAVY
jgi:hypothetical protein